MKQITVLWIDDEIDLLKPHLLFLEGKGYRVITAANGNDALKYVSARKNIDIIFLDEQMPGKSGLEVLNELKRLVPAIPLVLCSVHSNITCTLFPFFAIVYNFLEQQF